MTVRIQDILAALDKETPFDLAESWDNVGLLLGAPDQPVSTVLIGLDPTTVLIDEAIARGADTIITHHPVIFKPLARIDTGSPEGRILAKALGGGIAMIACHTNLDSSPEGVSDILAAKLGLVELRPLVPSAFAGMTGTGTGRIGVYPQPQSGAEFVDRVMKALALTVLPVAGPLPATVKKVAVCGGSGSDFAAAAHAAGADVYLTAEVKHNIARWAEERGFCIIDGSHYGTEQGAVRLLADKLTRLATDNGWAMEILQTTQERPPFVWLQSKRFTPT
ncbi:MAG: Nif3-like dinuclear metal center hexameric protein [Desulfopila sp.]